MSDVPRQKLSELVRRFGLEISEDPRRCEALLKDFCGDKYRREIFVLVGAVRERAAYQLAYDSGAANVDALIVILTSKLRNNLGFSEEMARWAIETWAVALQIENFVPSASRNRRGRATALGGDNGRAERPARRSEQRKESRPASPTPRPPAPEPDPIPGSDSEVDSSPKEWNSDDAVALSLVSLIASAIGGFMLWPALTPVMNEPMTFLGVIGHLFMFIAYLFFLLIAAVAPAVYASRKEGAKFRRSICITWPIMMFACPALASASILFFVPGLISHFIGEIVWLALMLAPASFVLLVFLMLIVMARVGIADSPSSGGHVAGSAGLRRVWVWLVLLATLGLNYAVATRTISLPDFLPKRSTSSTTVMTPAPVTEPGRQPENAQWWDWVSDLTGSLWGASRSQRPNEPTPPVSVPFYETVPPTPLPEHQNVQPEYPTLSRQRGEQGTVGLLLRIAPDGRVIGVEVASSSGFAALDAAARTAAQAWRFRPASRGGVPVEGTLRTSITFRLTPRDVQPQVPAQPAQPAGPISDPSGRHVGRIAGFSDPFILIMNDRSYPLFGIMDPQYYGVRSARESAARARQAVATRFLGLLAECEPANQTHYTCFVGDRPGQLRDLAEVYLLNGAAIAAPQSTELYRSAERSAADARRGLWSP